MKTNYVLLIGLFLLVVVDFSTADSEGDVNQITGLDQNVDVTLDSVKNTVLENVVDQVKDEEGHIQSDTNHSDLKQLSGSNEGEDLPKGGKESNDEATEKTNSEKGDNGREALQESNIKAKIKIDGGQRGDNADTGREEANVDAEQKADVEKLGDNVLTGKEEPNVDAKQKTGGEKQADNVHMGEEEPSVNSKEKPDGDSVHTGQKELNVDAERKTDGEKEGKDVHTAQGDNEHTGVEEQNVEAKRDIDDEEQGDNVHIDQEGRNADAKQKTDGDEYSDKVHMGQEEPNAEAKRMKDDDQQGDNQHKDQEESIIKTEGKQHGEQKENLGDEVNTNGVAKRKHNAADLVPPPPPTPTRKDVFQSEECDPSNMCMDKNKRFAACLRVPGNESPDLSLLIQNKGKEPLNIKISAPAFVQLGETSVGLQEKQHKEVKVSIKDYGKGNLIVLKDGIGECSLDFKDFVVHGSANSYVNALSRTPATTLIFVAAILILALGWVCMSLKRRRLAKSGLKYQKLDMELPVYGKVKIEPDVNDEWDNSWGDNWDDEEAPMTPTMPATPSLSSKGLASRRLGKEGWKD